MSLEQAVKTFRDAFANNASLAEPFAALIAASHAATERERDAAILMLLDGPNDSGEVFGWMCVASGALVEDGASTTLGLEPMLDRMAEGAALLAAAGPALDDANLDEQHAAPPEALSRDERRWVAGWKNCVRGVMARCARDVSARKRMRAHERFEPAVRALAERTWANHLRYVVEVLDMLDDEPLHVIDLCAGGKLQRYRASAIRNGFHLITVLDGQDPHVVADSGAAFVTAKHGYYTWPALEQAAHGFEATNLGALLWGEPRAVDLPRFEGVRTVIKAPATMARSWDTQFVAPIHPALREALVLETELSIPESRPILERIVQATKQ